jgi:hypothetical protein
LRNSRRSAIVSASNHHTLEAEYAMFVGILLLLMGVLILLGQLDIIEGAWWDYFWPLAIIAVGASMIFKHTKRQPHP